MCVGGMLVTVITSNYIKEEEKALKKLFQYKQIIKLACWQKMHISCPICKSVHYIDTSV